MCDRDDTSDIVENIGNQYFEAQLQSRLASMKLRCRTSAVLTVYILSAVSQLRAKLRQASKHLW
ncbi:MAG TPA: hypothetical protein VFV14_03840 [Myxococcaceae bacterium]|nr:hypothetical protein [Myxococcaceae bacterium]